MVNNGRTLGGEEIRKITVNNGGSYQMVIPQKFAEELGLKGGDYIKMKLLKKEGMVMLRKAELK